MIKVVVAVAGLALVELPEGGPIAIHLPITKDFHNVSPLIAPDGSVKPFEMDEHRVVVVVRNQQGSDSDVTEISGPDPFQIEIGGPSTGLHQSSALVNFADLDSMVGRLDVSVRRACKFGEDALSNCKGLTPSGPKELLAGQIRLSGIWTLMAAESGTDDRIPIAVGSNPAHMRRHLVSDEFRSTIQATGARRLADTFLFVAEVDDPTSVEVDGVIGGSEPQFYKPDDKFCDLVGGPCRVLWIENSPYCGLNVNGKNCVHPQNFLCKADTHFAQLYRLLDGYEPDSGTFRDPIFVPFSTDPGPCPVHAMGDGSPKCYGGYISP